MSVICCDLRWNGILRDALVAFVVVAFALNVMQRVQHVIHRNGRHTWHSLYDRTALVLDIATLALQAVSEYASQESRMQNTVLLDVCLLWDAAGLYITPQSHSGLVFCLVPMHL